MTPPTEALGGETPNTNYKILDRGAGNAIPLTQ